jgi:hypothetical protein
MVAYCRVSYRDLQGIQHSVLVEAESLYEAGALAVKRFRDTLWEGCPPGPGCELSVRMHREAPTDYTVSLQSILEYARDKTVRSPRDQMKKARLREWLGIRD